MARHGWVCLEIFALSGACEVSVHHDSAVCCVCLPDSLALLLVSFAVNLHLYSKADWSQAL